MSDEEIYRLIYSHNQEGLSMLLDRYGRLISYIVKNTGISNPDDASDCISDILFTIWKRIRKYDRSKSSFKTWVVIVTRGCAIDYMRKNKKHNTNIALEDVQELIADPSSKDGMDDNNIIGLLQELPPPDNEIFYRRFVLGETIAEIADIVGLNQESVYKRISRGKEKLKKLMEREGYCYV